jgi:CheY-like chemotaxis protein
VICAVNGAEGVDMAKRERPDLVLMDLSMPVLDGWEATRLLKGDEATRRIPVIALTSRAMPGDREKAVEVGCDDYETKPLDFHRLIEKIEKHLTGAHP